MGSYIYSVLRTDAEGQTELLNSSTKKHVITDYLTRDYLNAGFSVAPLMVVRVVDGRPATVSWIDVYTFLDIDLGEE